MALEKLDEESIKAFKFLGFMQVKTKSGKWLSYKSLLDYALKLESELAEKNMVIDQLQNSHKTNENAPRLSLKEKVRVRQGGAL